MITPREFGEKMARCWKGYEPVPGKKPYSEDSCRPVGSKKKKKSEKKAAQPYQNKLLDAQVPAYKARVAGAVSAMDKLMGKKPKPPVQAPMGDVAAKPGVKGASAKNAPEVGQKMAGSPAWQKSDGKNPEGGLNEKGRKSYERETGGNLKAPVTEANPKGERAKRQNSFCSRMCGMKRVNTGAKAKKDPDSRINKSLRKWNCKCSSAMAFGEKLAQNGNWSPVRFDPSHAQRAIREHLGANPNIKLDYDIDSASPRQLYDTAVDWGKYQANETPNTFQSQMSMRYKNKVPKPPLPGAVMAQPRAPGLGASQPAGSGGTGPAMPATPAANMPVPPVTPPSPQPSGLTQPIPQNPPRI